MKKIISLILCISLLLTMPTATCFGAGAPKESQLYARSAVLMDADSGRVLYSKDGENPMANASTTKILTCIVALEYCEMDAIVTISSRAASAPKVHLGTHNGQRFYMLDLLHALMLESFNDCAVAIAEHIAGSVEEFAKIMNSKAKEIGCKDTYFITPNGLDAKDETSFHHTTAEDLALMMRYCISQSEKSEDFRAITATRNYSFCEIDKGTSYSCVNRNAFLDMMQGAFSGKTGFTGNAGYCYVGALNRDGKNYIVALLACGWPNNKTYKWADSKKLMQYGIDEFVKVKLSEVPFDESKLEQVLVANGQGSTIEEFTYADLKIGKISGLDEVLLGRSEEIKICYDIKRNWEAPVKADSYAGTITVSVSGERMRQYEVLVAAAVEAKDFAWCMRMIFACFLNGFTL